jgi:acetyltransferase-like isoleucine patch superfamily enzyme
MNVDEFTYKAIRELKNIFWYLIFQYPRILKYRILSNCKNVIGSPALSQPTQMLGQGAIVFGNNVRLGVNPSPYLYSGYGYLDARKTFSRILIGNNVWINNNFKIISGGEGVDVGDNVLIGFNVEISDSDFHNLHPKKRFGGVPKTAKVCLLNNVFIGNNVKILKGVTIGENSIIANGSVVTRSVPPNVIAGGNPARVIKEIELN